MGRRFGTPEMEELKKRFFYEIVPGEFNEPLVQVGGRTFRLEEVASLILSQLRDNAQDFLEKRVKKAVISVPAYFTQKQRESVRKAGEMADLEVLRIINEPTAAALAYGFGKKQNQKILVYDLGGGTLDVTILQMHEEVYEVIGTGGDSFLGGIDFDNRIVDRFLKVFYEETGVDLSGNFVALQRLREAAEQAKIDLSSVEEVDVHLPFLGTKDGKALDFRYRLTRKEFNELTKDLVERTLVIAERTLAEARLSKENIDEILFVGGMTRCPLVYEMATRYFRKKPRKDVHPDEVVATGAALLANAIIEGKSAMTLVDVVPVSIGIEVGRGEFRKIIQKNTPLPLTRSLQFKTAIDNQKSFRIRFYQGESKFVEKNEFLGELLIGPLPPKPKGEVEVALTIHLTNDSQLILEGKNPQTKEPLKTIFQTEKPRQLEKYRADQILDKTIPPPSSEPAPPPPQPITANHPSNPPTTLPWYKKLFSFFKRFFS